MLSHASNRVKAPSIPAQLLDFLRGEDKTAVQIRFLTASLAVHVKTGFTFPAVLAGDRKKDIRIPRSLAR
jgi:hypothetical protein